MRYYYFHGFGSNPEAKKCTIMKDVLGDKNVYAPDFNVASIAEADTLLHSLAAEMKPNAAETCIIGSSLGGLYAIYVAAKSGASCILLNPCLFPQLVIPSITDDVPVENIVYAQRLSLSAYEGYQPAKVRVWVTKDDDLIDHNALTKPYFHRGCAEYLEAPQETARGHEFDGFTAMLKKYL